MHLVKILIALALLAFLTIAWFLGAAGLFAFIKYKKGYDAIQYADVAFPWNWDELRPKWGDYFIEKGVTHQQNGEWDQAFYFTRVGVAKSPANLKGRLLLADMLFQANDVVQAVKVLEGGLEFAGKDEAFWGRMIQFLQYYQADREIIRILGAGIEQELIPESQMEGAQAALAKAYYHQARYDEALDLISKSPAIPVQIVRSQIHWDQGLESLAIQSLESLNSMFPNQREVVPLLTRFYEKSGEVAKAQRLARTTYLNNPYSVGAAVNYFQVLGDEAPVEIGRFLERVPDIYDNQEALFLMANYLAENGFHEILSEVMQNAKPGFRESPMVWFLQLEALVNGEAYDQAAKILETPPSTVNALIPLHRILYQSLAMTTHFARGANDKGKIAMQQLFASGHLRPATLLRLARKLIEIERAEEAGQVLQFLLKQNPGNQAAMAEKVRIEIMRGNTGLAIDHSRDMVENKSMPFALKKELMAYLGADAQLFHKEAATLVDDLLGTTTPSKKRQLLEAL